MCRAAWVCRTESSTTYDDGERFERETEAAWVFPDGLEVGKRVQYFEKDYVVNGYVQRYRLNKIHTKAIAVGEVAEVEGDKVQLSWAGAASQSGREPWQTRIFPVGRLQMAPSGCGKYERERSHEHQNQLAERCDQYCIQVPQEAWALLPQRLFPVTLMKCSVAENYRLCVKVVTLGGREMEFKLAEDSKVQALMQLVTDECQLGGDVAVKVVIADETFLEPRTLLQVVVAS